ncbi:PfkB family carbohydrate kinase [Pararoseomonas indoligenes]|uniref:Ribokinase n=1 Tax=Roseomonas indoligenes TaxID=2820811 RepID=A0A940S610_9PROT|nr:PfkB family carbohydrate kinase [Pararoseomonas indoligenes]MBP0493559.1 ribokinase [Pararoseomonas indoligenes]
MPVTVFGSANADLVFPVESLPAPGHTVLGGAWRALPGGKGANQAVAAARDGAAVRFVGAVGRDPMAAIALSALREAGADLSAVAKTEEPTGAACICVDAAGRNQIAVSLGANALARAAGVPPLAPGEVLLMQMEVPPDENAALIRRARAEGALSVLNLAPAAPMEPDALRALHLLVANEHEAAWLAAHLGCASSAAGLHAALGITVAVTLGEAGAEAAGKGGRWHIPAFPVHAVDTSGAGDAWCGVLAAALGRGVPLEPAMRRAAAAAALACTRPGAAGGMPLAAETEALLGAG